MEAGKTVTLREIGDYLSGKSSVAVVSHLRPDGDAIGSIMALGQVLKDLGKDVLVMNHDGVPENYLFLQGKDMVLTPASVSAPVEVEVVVALDSAEKSRIGEPVWDCLKGYERVINMDHHISNPGYGDWNFVDADAPAAGQIVYDLIECMGWPLDEVARDALWVAIVTDTGSFKYPSTTARTFEVAARLVEAGVRVGDIAEKVYDSYPVRRLKLLRELLGEMKLTGDGQVASWRLRREVVERLGILPSDTEGLIDAIRSVDTVRVAIFFEEMQDGKVRISVRSKSGGPDVSAICGQFGGGGHMRAAGARMTGPMDEAAEQFLKAVHESLNG